MTETSPSSTLLSKLRLSRVINSSFENDELILWKSWSSKTYACIFCYGIHTKHK
jgi:hypothetical protein